MSQPNPRAVLSHIHRLAGLSALENCPDRELLECYRQRNDETAFAVLVRRHGPLVWGTCRRLLGDSHDTEDAYQAVFLVLARKAGFIRKAESLAAWLHRVARQVALRAKTGRDRRCKVENGCRVDAVTETQAARTSGLSEELSLREALAILDEEIERLPDKFRAPIVLCYLQGRTNEEVARELGCPAGTLKSRLGRARELLNERLIKRGVGLSVGAAAVLLATSASEAALVPAAARLAAVRSAHDSASASANVGQLARELMSTMTMNKIKLWAAGFLALAIVGAGAGILVRQTVSGSSPVAVATPSGDNARADEPKVKADLHGDPLPAGALVRLGTVRWRHGMRGNVVAFAAGGKEIVTGGPDGLLRVWDLATGRELRRLGTPLDPKAQLRRPAAVSANGRWAATSGKDCVHVWDVESGKELQQIKVAKMDDLLAIGLTPDGKSVLISHLSREGVVLWDVATCKEQLRFEPTASRFAFSPDGKFLVTPYYSGQDNGVRIWDVATGKEVRSIEDNTKLVNNDFPPAFMSPAFSPDGKVIARVTLDGTIHLHDSKTGKEQQSFGKAEKYPVAGLVFSPDSKSLAVLRTDRTIQLLDTATGKGLLTLDDGHERTAREAIGGPVYSTDLPPLAFAPDGKTLAVIYGSGFGQNVVRLWDTTTGKPLPELTGHAGAVVDLLLTVDGKKTVTLGEDRTLRFWDTGTGKEVQRDPLPGAKELSALSNGVAVLSKTGGLLAYAADKKTLALWDVTARKATVNITLPPNGLEYNSVSLANFSPDEKVLATTEMNGTVRLWDTANGKEMRALTVAKGGGVPGVFLYPRALEFSPDGKKLLTVQVVDTYGVALPGAPPPVDSKSRFGLWDTATGKKLRDWEVAGAVLGATFAPDGRSLATVGGDGVTLWETATGKERCRGKEVAALVAFSPDGRVLAASDGSTIRLLNARTLEEIGRLKGHEGAVQALAFTRDGKSLVSGSADSTALVWDFARLAPSPKIDEQSAETLARLWTDLEDEDVAKAYRAAVALAASPKGTAALLAKQIKPIVAPEPKQLAQWVADLDNDSFEVREKAATELERLGNLSRATLEDALKNKPSLDVHKRIEDLLGRLESRGGLSPEDLRHIRAVEVLESMATPEAKHLLEELAKGAADATVTREANASLRRLGK